jgi:hypothetical protein
LPIAAAPKGGGISRPSPPCPQQEKAAGSALTARNDQKKKHQPLGPVLFDTFIFYIVAREKVTINTI